jgi:hypothetical protein
LVVKAVEKYLQDHDQMSLATAFGEVETREVVVREGRLSAAWRNAMGGLKPGQASDVLTDRFGFEALVLLERSEAKVLAPAQAYPLVEEALLGKKMQKAFDQWLSENLATADISVSEHLLAEAQEEVNDFPIIPDEQEAQEPEQPEEIDMMAPDVPDTEDGAGQDSTEESVEESVEESMPPEGAADDSGI